MSKWDIAMYTVAGGLGVLLFLVVVGNELAVRLQLLLIRAEESRSTAGKARRNADGTKVSSDAESGDSAEAA